jgi:hypothetical protein
MVLEIVIDGVLLFWGVEIAASRPRNYGYQISQEKKCLMKDINSPL